MSLHYSDESKRERECPGCTRCTFDPNNCNGEPCDGTGRLGDPGAQPDFEVVWHDSIGGEPVWSWRTVGLDVEWIANVGACGPDWQKAKCGFGYPTEAAAVEAARRALGVRS